MHDCNDIVVYKAHPLDDFGSAQGVLRAVERLDHHSVGGEGFQQGDGVVVYLLEGG